MNETSKKQSGFNKLERYLISPECSTKYMRDQFNYAIENYGDDILQFLYNHQRGLEAIKSAIAVANFVKQGENNKFIAKTIRWLINYKWAMNVKTYRALNLPPTTLRRAIEENRGLTVQLGSTYSKNVFKAKLGDKLIVA